MTEPNNKIKQRIRTFDPLIRSDIPRLAKIRKKNDEEFYIALANIAEALGLTVEFAGRRPTTKVKVIRGSVLHQIQELVVANSS